MKGNSGEDMEKEEKRKKEPEEKEAEESEEVEESDFKFHDNFSEIKDATPLFKPSDLEQFVSQAEVPKEVGEEEKKSEKEKKEQLKYSVADYTAQRSMEWHEKDMIADVDDLRRIGTFVDRGHEPEFRRDFSISRPRAEMPELSEMKNKGTANEMIVKYADKRRDDFWKEGMDSMRRKEIKKYKVEA